MTPRTVTSFGLIAGITYTETRSMTPGELCDYYIQRQAYDDQQHGIKRSEQPSAKDAGIK